MNRGEDMTFVPLDKFPGQRQHCNLETQICNICGPNVSEHARKPFIDTKTDLLTPRNSGDKEDGRVVVSLVHQGVQTDAAVQEVTVPDGVLQDIADDTRHLGRFLKKHWKVALTLFFKRCGIRLLWLAYWFSRLCTTFWILEAAAMLCALSVNVVVQFVIGMFVPVAKQDEKINEDIVYTASFFFLVALLYPILSLIPSVFSLVLEVWDHQELPSTRLMCVYIHQSLDKAMEHKNREFDPVSKAIRIVKAFLVFFILIISAAVQQSQLLELFFTIGLVIGITLWCAWILLRLVMQGVALWRGNVSFPTTAVFVAMQYYKSQTAGIVNFVQKAAVSPRRKLHMYVLGVFFSCHLVISLFVIGFALRELNASGETTFGAICLLILGLAYTYYNIFSSNDPQSTVLPQEKYGIKRFKKKLTCLCLRPPTPNRVADSCIVVAITMILLIIIMAIAGEFVRQAQEPKCDGFKVTNISEPNRNRRNADSGDLTLYDICSQRWFGLTAMDVVLLADISYKEYDTKSSSGECSVEAHQFIAKYFPQPIWDWEIIGAPAPGELVGFLVLHSHRLNVTVISVRGTRFSHLTDLMQDADLYTEVATLQFFSLFIPITTLLPLETVADIIYFSSVVERVFRAHRSSSYHTILSDHIKNKMEEYGNRIIITGHSLGGSLGKISGATLNIRAISINGPGLLYSHEKFGLLRSKIDTTAVNIVAKGDLVSEIDRLGGTTYRLGCSSGSPISCHRLTAVACEIQEKCQFHEGGRFITC